MFHDQADDLRPDAERAAKFARSLLDSLTDSERSEIVKRLEIIFTELAKLLGYSRKLTWMGPLCSRYVWLPPNARYGRMQTDFDFIDHQCLLTQPAYLALSKQLSRNRPNLAHRLIICALVVRDWNLGDYESIHDAQEIIDAIQLAIIQEAAGRRAGQRIGGRKKLPIM